MIFVYTILLFLIGIIIYNIVGEIYTWNTTREMGILGDIEGFENQECTDKMSSMVYKNNGAIQNLQESVEKMMQQLNELVLTTDKQETEISNLSSLQTKFDTLAQKADELANDNKQQLIELAKEAHQRANQAQQEADKLPSP